jgi:ATP-dependent Clp protease protease subunit
VRMDIERDLWMPAEEAVGYGLVSRIIRRRDELPAI